MDVAAIAPDPDDPDWPAKAAAARGKFLAEHTHDEDEVRFILAGRGIFFLHINGRVASVEVGPGDMLRVPRGTTHWFSLCEDRRIRAIRWFQDTTGWTPRYTDSGVDKSYQPLCFGPVYLGARVESRLGSDLTA